MCCPERFATAVSRWKLPGRLVDLIGTCRGDAEFGRDRVDRLPGDIEIHPVIGVEVWTDVVLVVALHLITRQPVQNDAM